MQEETGVILVYKCKSRLLSQKKKKPTKQLVFFLFSVKFCLLFHNTKTKHWCQAHQCTSVSPSWQLLGRLGSYQWEIWCCYFIILWCLRQHCRRYSWYCTGMCEFLEGKKNWSCHVYSPGQSKYQYFSRTNW